MKTNAKKFENILKIFDMLVESRNYVTSKTFAEKLNVTERTVFRYIQEIALAFSPYEPIEASYEGYRLFKHDFIDLLNNRDDYFTIASININTFGKLLNKKIKFPEEFLKKIMERIELKSNIPESILRPLLKAIMEGRICEIQYQQIDKILNTSVVLLKLVSKDSIFYLNIYDTSDDKCKLIAVDKIKEINLTANKLMQEDLQKHFDFINSAWGILITSNIAEVTFEINNDILVYFEKNPVHQSQRIEKTKNKNIVHLKIHNSKEFIRWAMRFGKHLKILEPEIVIQELKEYLNEMNKFYS